MGENKLLRPYLKWAGGKRQLANEIVQMMPHNYKSARYYEPFVGAGAILFHIKPINATINDLNEELSLTYRVIRDDVENLILKLKDHKKNNSSEYFYEIREMDRNPNFFELSDVDRAARLIYLNKTCYNGLYRVNSQGLFNTPYGRYKNPAICEDSVLKAVSRYLKENDIKILNGDFVDATTDAKKGDFVYFDPPYDSPGCTNFTGYQADKFDQSEQKRLRDLMIDLTDRGVRCMMSNASTDYIKKIYSEDSRFHITYLEAARNINSNGNGRGKVEEVLVMNYEQ